MQRAWCAHDIAGRNLYLYGAMQSFCYDGCVYILLRVELADLLKSMWTFHAKSSPQLPILVF